jgi:hypothetical protein
VGTVIMCRLAAQSCVIVRLLELVPSANVHGSQAVLKQSSGSSPLSMRDIFGAGEVNFGFYCISGWIDFALMNMQNFRRWVSLRSCRNILKKILCPKIGGFIRVLGQIY